MVKQPRYVRNQRGDLRAEGAQLQSEDGPVRVVCKALVYHLEEDDLVCDQCRRRWSFDVLVNNLVRDYLTNHQADHP